MIESYLKYIPPAINTIGLICDIYGAILIAHEVVNQFKGEQFMPIETRIGHSPAPDKSPEYSYWEINKYNKMKKGLIFLLTGFILQIISAWLPNVIL